MGLVRREAAASTSRTLLTWQTRHSRVHVQRVDRLVSYIRLAKGHYIVATVSEKAAEKLPYRS